MTDNKLNILNSAANAQGYTGLSKLLEEGSQVQILRAIEAAMSSYHLLMTLEDLHTDSSKILQETVFNGLHELNMLGETGPEPGQDKEDYIKNGPAGNKFNGYFMSKCSDCKNEDCSCITGPIPMTSTAPSIPFTAIPWKETDKEFYDTAYEQKVEFTPMPQESADADLYKNGVKADMIILDDPFNEEPEKTKEELLKRWREARDKAEDKHNKSLDFRKYLEDRMKAIDSKEYENEYTQQPPIKHKPQEPLH